MSIMYERLRRFEDKWSKRISRLVDNGLAVNLTTQTILELARSVVELTVELAELKRRFEALVSPEGDK